MRWRHATGLLAICVVLRIVSLARPCLSDDEATYAVVAREMLAGRALYKDVVDHKPPAIYVVNEATQALGGPVGGMVLLHILLILVVWSTSLVIARLVQRHADGDPVAPSMAALLWIVFTTTLVDADSLAANCELFMMLPLVASMYLFLEARARLWPLVASGALVGVAMLFKYQAGIQLPVYAVALAIARRKQLGQAALGLVALGLGVVAPIGAAIGWLALHGALASAWFWFRFNFAYIDAGGSGTKLQALIRIAFTLGCCAPLYVFAVVAPRRRRPFDRLVYAWLAASIVAVCVGGRFFGHYFHQITAPLAVIAAPAALAFARNHRRVFVALLAVPAAAFLVLGAVHDRMMTLAGEPDPDYHAVTTYLDAHGSPDDALCIWGNSPVLYFDANRPLGCRFVFANYLTGASPATPTQKDPDVDSSMNIVPEAWDMLRADLAARRPLWIVDGSPGNVAFYGKYPPAKFPIGAILACYYRPDADVAGMRIYRRRDAACDR